MAPDARIVNMKVGASDGATDVSQVIAALDWVVQHHSTGGLNIKIVSLSFGLNSSNPYTIDPLAYAAEVAWQHGLMVVAAGGNDGTTTGKLASPAYDPYVMAVGGSDRQGTTTLSDDTVCRFREREEVETARSTWWHRPATSSACGCPGPTSTSTTATPGGSVLGSSGEVARRRPRPWCRASPRCSISGSPTPRPTR